MKYDAIIFDFNGVLLLDREWHEEAWNMVSSQLRGQTFSKEEADQHIHGRTPKETFIFLSPNADEQKLRELNLLKEQKYHQVSLSQNEKFRLSPGAEGLFDFLKQHNIKFTIATSSPIINLDFYFKHLNLAKWFDRDKVVYDDGSHRSKPAPDMFLEAARRLNTDIGSCIVVEDAPSGIQAAINAKAGKIILFSPDETVPVPEGVDRAISNLTQITLANFQPVGKRFQPRKKSLTLRQEINPIPT